MLLIDVINDLDFPEANQLLRYARPMAKKLSRLKQRAKKAGVPVIYVNDNFGRWQSDFRRQVQHCLRDSSRGHEIVSVPPTSSGGTHIVQGLNILEGFDVAGLGFGTVDGVHTVAQLKTQDATKLNDEIMKANSKSHLSENPPSVEHLQAWIAQAQTLPIVLH